MAYTIQQGDTLNAIAQSNNTTVAALLAANSNITNPNLIYAGSTLNILNVNTGTVGTPNINPVISTNVLQGNGTQPQLPSITPTATPQQFVAAIPTPTPVNPTDPNAVSAATTQIGGLETQRTALQKRLADAQQQLLGQGQEQINLETNAGIPQSVKDINALNEQIAAKKLAFDQAANDVTGRPIGIERQTGKIAQIQRNEAIQLGGLSALALAKQGSLEAAKAEVDRTLKMEFDPIKQEIENTKTFLDLNYQDLDRAEKKQAEALRIQLDREDRDIKIMEDRKNVLLKYALENNIGSDAYGKILSAKNGTDLTQASNLLFDNVATNVGIEPKVLTTSDYKTIQGLAPAIKAVNDYKAAVQKWGTNEILSGKGRGEIQSSYGDAISAWKTLAQLGALSGADFGLAENVIPKPSFFSRTGKVITQLDGTLERAVFQSGNLIGNLKLAFPKSSSGLDTILNHALTPNEATNDPLGLGIEGGDNLNPLGL